MKKVLFTLCVLAGFLSASAQSQLYLHFDTWANATGSPKVANQPFWVNITFGVNSIQYALQTDANGRYFDTVFRPTGALNIDFITYDCNGNRIVDSRSLSPSQNVTGDTAIVPCALQLNCQTFIHTNTSTTGLTYNFMDSSLTMPSSNDISRISSWNFGDGNSAYVVNGFGTTHTYAAPGTYNVCLISAAFDTLYGVNVCEDTVCQTITVGGGNPSNFCTAAYWVDTLGSGAGTVNIYNSSTPAHNSPNHQSSYSWDFGDGSAPMTGAFPTHTYASPGLYQVCLTITSADAQNNTCTDTYCDSLGVDANGNLIYKTTAGFTLNVLDPNTIGLNEVQLRNVELYPNPATDVVNVSLGNATGQVSWQLADLKGSQLKQGNVSDKNLSIDVSGLNTGVYILSLETADAVGNYKLIVE